MSNIVTIDSKGLDDLFAAVDEEHIKPVIMKSLQDFGNVVKEDTQNRLIAKMGDAANRTTYRKSSDGGGKLNKPMTKGVKVTRDDGYEKVVVSILKDYRLKWFELGTKMRKLLRTGAKDRTRGRMSGDRRYLYRKKGKENFYKAGSNRGQIKPLHFFKEVRENIDFDKFLQIIDKNINKLFS